MKFLKYVWAKSELTKFFWVNFYLCDVSLYAKK